MSKGSLTLGALSYLHVGTSLRGSELKPRMVLVHGWMECGSCQAIWSSIQRSYLPMNC